MVVSPIPIPLEADVVIDFSSAAAIDALLDWCEEKKMPVVLCSTGLSEVQIARATKSSTQKIAVLKSANMSLGINTLLKLLKEAAATLAPAGFDIEIVEKHHNLKVDAPSGTALALADAINDEMMTADELNETITAALDLAKELEEEQTMLEHDIHVNPGREDELKPLAEMAERIRRILEVRAKTYKKIAKGLD